MAHWILTCNPKRWRIFDAIADGVPVDRWRVTNFRDELQPGDDVAVWVAGSNLPGVYALGEVTGPVARMGESPSADNYWAADEGEVDWRVPIRLTQPLFDRPLLKVTLECDERFKSASVLAQPWSSNPFRVSDAEWRAIADASQQDASTLWTLRPGDELSRRELHSRYGGSVQDGITSSSSTPNVFLFSDPVAARRHGYEDRWLPDGVYLYTGQGQKGDQQLTRNNKALLDHRQNGRALRLFEVNGTVVRYAGEFTVDPDMSVIEESAPEGNGGALRKVLRFRLLRASEPSPDAPRAGKGRISFHPLDRDIVVSPALPVSPDPALHQRALLMHLRLTIDLGNDARSHGLDPVKPLASDPPFDLAWQGEDAFVVVEIKSITKSNEVSQLRTGLGQLLDYADTLLLAEKQVRAVLYVERPPTDPRWVSLTARHGVELLWPGNHGDLFPEPST